MHIPVLIEPLSQGRFRARSGEPLALTADGATRDESLRNVETQIRERLTAGAELFSLEVPTEPPWVRFAGTLDDNDPLVQEWLGVMAERRREDDEREFGTTERLLESLDPIDEHERAAIDQAWADEAERRIAAWRQGRIRTIPGEDVLQSLRFRAGQS